MFDVLGHLDNIRLMSFSVLCIIRFHCWALPELRFDSRRIWSMRSIKIVWYSFNISSSYIWLIFISDILLDVLITSIIRYALTLFGDWHTSLILIWIPCVGTHIGILLGIINLLRLLYVYCLTDGLSLLFLWCLNGFNFRLFSLSIYLCLVFIASKLLVIIDMYPRGLLNRLLISLYLFVLFWLNKYILFCVLI